jgi:GAF domain-containing protein
MIAKLGESLHALARRGSDDVEVTLPELVMAVLRVVPDADCAGIAVRRRDGDVETLSATHPSPSFLDELQGIYPGPAVCAVQDNVIIRIDDLVTDERWPHFGHLAVQQTPVRSMLVLPLLTGRRTGGALTLYAERPAAFDEDDVEVARIFAAYAALAWRQHRRGEQFREALASRDVIGQAKGMIMERFEIDAAEAFELLRQLSQTMNIPVFDVARRLTDRVVDPSSVTPR